MTTTTLTLHGAQFTAPTEDLFQAWLRDRLPVRATLGELPILTAPHLAHGETYLGAFVSADGKHQHHTILLPFDRDDAPWEKQMNWAKGEGFDLPHRLEMLMMWLTMRTRFQQCAYWSNESHHEDTAYAWYQFFSYGTQSLYHKSLALRAVAVRRIVIGD